MSHRILAAALVLSLLGGFAAAETYVGVITELADSKLTLKSRKKDETKLDVAEKVQVVRRGDKPLPFAALKRMVGREKGSGVFARLRTEGGKVVRIEIGGEGLPEKAATILAKADRMELYSLEPEPADKDKKAPGATFIDDALVLGKTVVKDRETLGRVREALDESVGRGRLAKCFDPRHAVRATAGKKTVLIVICFHCGQAYFYYDGEKEPSAKPSISKGSQIDLDKILKAAGVPLAKPVKE